MAVLTTGSNGLQTDTGVPASIGGAGVLAPASYCPTEPLLPLGGGVGVDVLPVLASAGGGPEALPARLPSPVGIGVATSAEQATIPMWRGMRMILPCGAGARHVRGGDGVAHRLMPGRSSS